MVFYLEFLELTGTVTCGVLVGETGLSDWVFGDECMRNLDLYFGVLESVVEANASHGSTRVTMGAGEFALEDRRVVKLGLF